MNLFKPKSPLADFLSATGPEQIQAGVEGARDRAAGLATAASLVTMACAGHFVAKSGAPLLSKLKASRDVFAFEALAFCAYAVRESYPSPAKATDEAFGMALGVCRRTVERHTGWSIGELFANRVLGYYGPGVGAFDPVAHFRTLLLSLGREKTPRGKYGPMSLSGEAQLMALPAVEIFASTIPKGYADSLRNIVDHFVLDR